MAPKLHEVLAVQTARGKRAAEIVSETKGTFSKKERHFDRKDLSFESIMDESTAEQKREAEEVRTQVKSNIEGNSHGMVTTVLQKLIYTFKFLRDAWDANLQIDATNQTAKADIVIDGRTLSKDVPATFLLWMAKQLDTVRDLCIGIPTLDPALGFSQNSDDEPGIFRAKDQARVTTKKTMRSHVAHPGTDKHPPQVQTYNEDVPVGRIVTQLWSSKYTPAAKSELLGRIDKLLEAVKKARMRANQAEVVQMKVAEDLSAYILNGTNGTTSEGG